MNHAELVDLATAVHNLRPDWQQPGVVSQLKTLASSWPGSRAAFYVHAITTAANPTARNPGALTVFTPAEPSPKTERWLGKDYPLCYICGLSRPRCNSLGIITENQGLETHRFETAEEARQRAVPPTPLARTSDGRLVVPKAPSKA